MLVNVNGKVHDWTLSANGTDWVRDFVGNAGGYDEVIPVLEGGDYTPDGHYYEFTASEHVAAWWERVIFLQHDVNMISSMLSDELDSELIQDTINDASDSDLDVCLAQELAALEKLAEEHNIEVMPMRVFEKKFVLQNNEEGDIDTLIADFVCEVYKGGGWFEDTYVEPESFNGYSCIKNDVFDREGGAAIKLGWIERELEKVNGEIKASCTISLKERFCK